MDSPSVQSCTARAEMQKPLTEPRQRVKTLSVAPSHSSEKQTAGLCSRLARAMLPLRKKKAHRDRSRLWQQKLIALKQTMQEYHGKYSLRGVGDLEAATGRYMAIECAKSLISSNGTLELDFIPLLHQHLCPQRAANHPSIQALQRGLQHLQCDSRLQKTLTSLVLPKSPSPTTLKLIRLSLQLPNSAPITDTDLRRTLLSTLFSRIRQERHAGNCFASAIAIETQQRDPVRMLRELYDLLCTNSMRIGSKRYRGLTKANSPLLDRIVEVEGEGSLRWQGAEGVKSAVFFHKIPELVTERHWLKNLRFSPGVTTWRYLLDVLAENAPQEDPTEWLPFAFLSGNMHPLHYMWENAIAELGIPEMLKSVITPALGGSTLVYDPSIEVEPGQFGAYLVIDSKKKVEKVTLPKLERQPCIIFDTHASFLHPTTPAFCSSKTIVRGANSLALRKAYFGKEQSTLLSVTPASARDLAELLCKQRGPNRPARVRNVHTFHLLPSPPIDLEQQIILPGKEVSAAPIPTRLRKRLTATARHFWGLDDGNSSLIDQLHSLSPTTSIQEFRNALIRLFAVVKSTSHNREKFQLKIDREIISYLPRPLLEKLEDSAIPIADSNWAYNGREDLFFSFAWNPGSGKVELWQQTSCSKRLLPLNQRKWVKGQTWDVFG